MKKIVLISMCLVVLSGCAELNDWVFGDAQRNAQRVQEKHRMSMAEIQSLIDSREQINQLYLEDVNNGNIDSWELERLRHNLEVEHQLRLIEGKLDRINRQGNK